MVIFHSFLYVYQRVGEDICLDYVESWKSQL
jgi:hypothetical protein